MLSILLANALAAAPPAASLPKGNVLILVVDTLRADVLGTYGNPRPTSPRIDAFARESLVFDRAWTQYTWTLPSFISYTTSRFARTHGWDYDIGQFDQYKTVDTRVPTLAEVLQANGYATSGHYSNHHLHEKLGFGKGFDSWKDGSDAETVAAGIADIKRWSSDGKPNFLYVHVMNCHTPWRPSPAAQTALGTPLVVPDKGLDSNDWPKLAPDLRPGRAAEYRKAYEAAVRDADAEMGQLLDALNASGEAGKTMVLFHADHGEALGDHGQAGHNRGVFEELAHVPMIVKVPGQKPLRVSDRMGRLIDLPPTVLDVVGLAAKAPPAWQGRSFYRQAEAPLAVVERAGEIAFSLDGKMKMLADRTTGAFSFGFDLLQDPAEKARQKDGSAAAFSAVQAAAKAWYAATPKGTNEGVAPKVSDAEKADTNELLKQLGYLE